MPPAQTATRAPEPKGWVAVQARLPAAMVFAFIGQAAVAVWQVSAITSTLQEHDRRLSRVESSQDHAEKEMSARGERIAAVLARLEATVDSLRSAVERLDRLVTNRPQ